MYKPGEKVKIISLPLKSKDAPAKGKTGTITEITKLSGIAFYKVVTEGQNPVLVPGLRDNNLEAAVTDQVKGKKAGSEKVKCNIPARELAGRDKV